MHGGATYIIYLYDVQNTNTAFLSSFESIKITILWFIILLNWYNNRHICGINSAQPTIELVNNEKKWKLLFSNWLAFYVGFFRLLVSKHAKSDMSLFSRSNNLELIYINWVYPVNVFFDCHWKWTFTQASSTYKIFFFIMQSSNFHLYF